MGDMDNGGMAYKKEIKEWVVNLRMQGRTYSEIRTMTHINFPKGTLSTWFQAMHFDVATKRKIYVHSRERVLMGVRKAAAIKEAKRVMFLEKACRDNEKLKVLLEDKDVAKIALMMLYWCEGSKTNRASLYFGNSSPEIISLFLRLLRACYPIDESKFRCTVQCRADQDVQFLKSFWVKVTAIPSKQFYNARIDKRTIGKPTKKSSYRGVYRIDYFSAAIYNELKIAETLFSGGTMGP